MSDELEEASVLFGRALNSQVETHRRVMNENILRSLGAANWDNDSGSVFTYEMLEDAMKQFDVQPKMDLIPSLHLQEQFRFPRSKKKRIRTKWAKRPENWRPAHQVYWDALTGNAYAHPQLIDKLEATAEMKRLDYIFP